MAMPLVSKVFGALNDELSIPCAFGAQWGNIQVVGAGVLTLQLQDSYDGGVTYNVVRTFSVSTGAGSASITAAGLYETEIAWLPLRPRLICTAFTSGTLTAYVRWAPRWPGPGAIYPMVTQLFDGAGQSRSLPASDTVEQVYALQVIGAGTLTLQIQDSYDGGVTYHAIQVSAVSVGGSAANITVAGLYELAFFLPLVRPRIAVTAFTSGSFTVQALGLRKST